MFKLPIEYSSGCRDLAPHIVADLELVESTSEAPSTYAAISGIDSLPSMQSGQHPKGASLVQKITSDRRFLRDTQRLLLRVNVPQLKTNMSGIWRDLRHSSGFKERYHYVDWTPFEWLNHDAVWLQCISVYQLVAPLLSLMSPLIMVLLPLLVIWANGQALTDYWTIFCRMASGHSIGRLFTQFGGISNEHRMWLLLSAAFYIFGTYQNIIFCKRFVEIQTSMCASLNIVGHFCRETVARIDALNAAINTAKATTYAPWVQSTVDVRAALVNLGAQIDKCDNGGLTKMGDVAKVFYDLHADADIGLMLAWSFDFNDYVNVLTAMSDALTSHRITAARLTTKGATSFSKLAYPPLCDAVRNDVSFAKGNIVITGPNASGKTTVIKAAILNVILTQQWGCGTYGSATVRLYDDIHCYMNIPDTSGRDSLFQAEARRCKQILDAVGSGAHFCVFDELYSGTNPEEATACSVKFIEYLGAKRIDCMFTTHFLGICEAKGIQCFGMDKYEMQPGVSRVHGGVQVLRDMGYPAEAIP